MPTVQTDILETVLSTRLGSFGATFGLAGDILDAFQAKLDATGRRALLLGAGFGAAAVGLGAFQASNVKAAASLEQTRMGFVSLLGSADAAEKKIAELQSFAKRSPFNFQDVARGSQQLLGAGAAAEKLIPIQEALGNVVATNGKSSEDFAEALRQVSQIISSGKVQGDELNILSERGLPRGEVIKALGKTSGATADEFVAALIKIGSSGKYLGGMEKQAQTLNGSLSSLQDAAQQLQTALGEPLLKPVTAAVRGLTSMVEAANNWSPAAKTATSWIVTGLAAGLAILAIKQVASIVHTGKLIKLLVEEAAAHSAAAGAANAHANALGRVAGSAPKGAAGGAGAGGRLGGVGGFLGALGLEAAGAAIIAGIPSQAQARGSAKDAALRGGGIVLGRATQGAGIGAMVGQPAVGAGIGALWGAIENSIDASQKPGKEEKTTEEKILEELQKQTRALEAAVDTKQVPLAYQQAAVSSRFFGSLLD